MPQYAAAGCCLGVLKVLLSEWSGQPICPSSLRALQEGGVATRTTADFRDLSTQDLSLLSGHLAILSHHLAQQAAAQQVIPDDLEG